MFCNTGPRCNDGDVNATMSITQWIADQNEIENPMNFPMSFKLDEEFKQRNRKHTKQERFNLERIIEEEGCADGALTVALIGTEKLLCDGYTTLSICQEKGITPTEARYLPFKDRAAVLEWIDRRQRSRRNLTAEEMAEERRERVPRIAEAKVEGKSNRAIAADEGISESQVRADLKEATAQGCAVNPPDGKIKGQDGGREQPASKPLPRCDRCTRIYRGSNKSEANCPQCEILRSRQTATKSRSSNAKQTKRPAQVSADPGPEVPKTKVCPNCKGTGRIPEKAKAVFTPPTLDEVRSYCEERKNGIDPEAFIAHYTTVGWVYGEGKGKAVKDWKACVITWEKSKNGGHKNGKPAPNAEREHAILMGYYKPSSGEAFDPQKHCEKP